MRAIRGGSPFGVVFCRGTIRSRLLAAALILGVCAAAGAGSIIRVRTNPTCSTNGPGTATNWSNAFCSLYDAIAAAQPGDEIWVAEGVWYPISFGEEGVQTDSFLIKRNVAIYGGFEGVSTEDERNDRDREANVTILSGANYFYHVVRLCDSDTCSGSTDGCCLVGTGDRLTTILDGFVIEDGFADGDPGDEQRGAGLFIKNGSPTIKNCVIRNNLATDGGGGVMVRNGSPHFTDCVIEDNAATNDNEDGEGGGALVVLEYTTALTADVGPHFLRCDFVRNVAGLSNGGGVKLYTTAPDGSEEHDDTEFTECRFLDNRLSFEYLCYGDATAIGAGMSISGSPLLVQCEFVGNGPWSPNCNESTINGGGVAINNYISATRNHTAVFQGCKWRENGHIASTNVCDELPGDPLEEDFVTHGGAVYIQRPADPAACPYPIDFDPHDPDSPRPIPDATFDSCQFISNLSGNGGAAFLDRAAATFTDCRFVGNQADGRTAHVLQAGPGGPCSNYAELAAAFGGGAISNYRLSYLKLEDCRFVRNVSSDWSGGAIYVYEGTTMDADRCWFVGNRTTHEDDDGGNGAAIWVDSHCLGIDNGCGAGHNFGTPEDPDIRSYYAVCNVYNSLFVGNQAAEWAGAIYNERAGKVTLVNCTIMNNHAGDGVGGVLAHSDETELPDEGEYCVVESYNCIIWGNTDGPFSLDSEQKGQLLEMRALDSPSPLPWPTAQYSCILSTHAAASVEDYQDSVGNIGDASGNHPGIPRLTVIDEPYWTAPADYEPTTGITTFTKENAGFEDLENKILNTFDEFANPTRSLIVGYTGDTIDVLGDLELFDDPGEPFEIELYEIDVYSTCYDSGNENLLPSPYNENDILERERVVYWKWNIDMGCYEQQDLPE